MDIPTNDEIRELYLQGVDAVIKYILNLVQIIQTHQDMLNKNSANSSKPPSSDGFKNLRTKSLRSKSNKSNGGQLGHKGKTLERVENPDHINVHSVKQCNKCDKSFETNDVISYQKRQVFDIPILKMEVTEHRAEIKICSCCGAKNVAEFPSNVSSSVQYGNNIKSMMVYLNNHQFIPLNRVREFFKDVFDHSVSESTILKANKACAENVQPINDAIKEQLIKSPIVNFDETGLKVKGKLSWMHVASTFNLTHYAVHPCRGKEAMDSIGILPNFKGVAVHDHWRSYFIYEDLSHSLCNAHHLRELKFIHEQYNQEWAEKIICCLMDIKNEVDLVRQNNDCLNPEKIKMYEIRYNNIIENELKINPPPIKKSGKRGRVKQSPSKNLLDRLKEHMHEVLAFMYSFSVPFDKIQAERDVRMMKLRQKISGTFRTIVGAEIFCAIRSYISTSRKNGFPILDAIYAAIIKTPFTPQFAQLG